ncbi:MAG: AsmA-like C-terminal domain-containing protein [Deltaproteobacteria bacterium]|nr:AsmA-like C-terminal domain-containing protein [Deltaproteobacteria bacterium]
MNKTHKLYLRSQTKKKSYLVRILVGLVALGLFFISLVSVFVTFFLYSESASKYLTSLIETAIEKKISYSQLSVSWLTFRNVNFSLKDFRLSDLDQNNSIFKAKEIDCELDIGLILLGSLSINHGNIVEPTLFLQTGPGFPDSISLNEKTTINLFGLELEFKHLELHQGIIVNRKLGLPSSHKEEVIFTGLEIRVQNFNPSGIEVFDVKGSAKEEATEGSFQIKGSFFSLSPIDENQGGRVVSAKFSDCPLMPFLVGARYFGIEIPISGADFSFAADAKFDSGKWAFSGVSIISGGFLKSNRLLRSKVAIDKIGARFAGTISQQSISLDFQEISLPGAVASLEIQVKNRRNPNPTVEISVQRAEIDLERISAFLPLSLFHASERDRIKQVDLKGNLQITNSFWSNNLSALLEGDFRSSEMALDVALNRVSGFIPGFSTPIREASGFVRLNSTEALFKGITLSLGSSPVVINGWISNLKTNPTVDLFISTNAYASDLREVLLHKSFSHRFESLLSRLIDPQGTAAITMDVKGNLSNPSLRGLVRLEEFQFRMDGLPFPIKKVAGDMRFRGSKVSFSGLKGLLGESPFELKGDVSQPELDLNFELKLGAADLRKFSFFPSGWNISGSTPVSLSLKGKPSNLGFTGIIDLSPVTITYESFVRKRTGTAVTVEFSGVRNEEGLSVEEAYLVSEAGRISAKALFKEDGKRMILVNLPPKGIPTSALIPFADPVLELQTGGRIEGDFSLRKERNQESNIDANVIFSHVSLRLPRFRKITEGLTGVYQRKSKFININIERSRTGSSQVSGNFSITDPDNPKLKFNIESEFLDTTDFTAPPGEISSITWQEWIRTNSVIRFLSRAKVSGNVHISKGKTEYRTFEDFRAELDGVSGLIKAPKWQMNFADGIVRGSANFDIRAQTVLPLKLDFYGDGLKFDRIFVSDPQRARVDGDMNVHGNLDWKIRASAENHGIYRTGVVDVVLTGGIIYRFEILSKLFSLINLGSLIRGRLPDIAGQGLPYQKITWKMEVFDNKWRFKDLKLFSDAARIDASGMYFSDQNRIDFKVQVSPLVGLDAIVSGLFGNLITKDGKILTTMFRVRGLYSSPDIRLEPFENLKMEN